VFGVWTSGPSTICGKKQSRGACSVFLQESVEVGTAGKTFKEPLNTFNEPLKTFKEPLKNL